MLKKIKYKSIPFRNSLITRGFKKNFRKTRHPKGSLVSPEKLRFDFSHNKPLENVEVQKIENYVNDMVNTKSDVVTRIMTPKEAVDNGALALFGEKYGDEVRVLSMGLDKNKYFSTELCAGNTCKKCRRDWKI
jgi:alanyl-tRNA synthetase